MRLPRYAAGGTNISSLESGKAALRTPGQAALAAGAKFSAIGDIADTAADTLNTMNEFNRKMDAADDKVTNAINDGHWQQALKGAKLEAEERSLSDPTWSKKNYAKQVEQINKTRMDAINQLKDPESRRQAERLIGAASVMSMQEAELDGLAIQAKRIATSLQTTYDQAVMDEDYEFASHLLDVGMDSTNGTPIVGSIKGQAARAKLNKLIDNKRVDEAAGELASSVEDAYLQNGQVGGDQAYEKLVRNTKLEDDVKKSALLQATQHRQNFMRSQVDEKSRESAQVIQTKTINSEDAKVGQFTEADNELALSSGDYGEPDSPTAMSAWAEVYRNAKSYRKSQSTVVDVTNAVNTGQLLNPTTENRDALDSYVSQTAETTGIEVDSDDYFRLVANTAQTTGLLPTRERNAINLGWNSTAQAKKYLPLVQYLEDNDSLNPNLGTNEKAGTFWSSVTAMTEYGMSATDAIESYYKAQDLNPADKAALELDYSEEQAATDAYSDFINSEESFAAADKFFDLSVSPETSNKMAMRYETVRQKVYMASMGNVTVADNAAAKAIKSGWGASNWGNSDPDDYTVQENPMGEDMHVFQEYVINQLNSMKVEGVTDAAKAGVTFKAYNSDNEFVDTKYLDPDDLSFQEVPQQEGEGRDGVRRYQVLSNGRPVINMDSGMVLDFPITQAESRIITNVSNMRTGRADEVQRINDRISELDKEIAEEQKVKSPYIDLNALESERAGLKRELPNAQMRVDQTQYAPYQMFSESQLPEIIN